MQRQAEEGIPANLPDVILQYLRLSNPTDQIRSVRKQHMTRMVNELKPAILKLSSDDAIKVASNLDGLISIVLLMETVNELRLGFQKRLYETYGVDISGSIAMLELKFEIHLDQILKQKRAFVRDDIDHVVELVLNECWSKATKKNSATPPDEFKQLVNNLVFVIAAGKVYRETDELQMANISQIVASKLKSFLVKPNPNSIIAKIEKLTPQKIKQPYEVLAFGFDLVEVTPDTAVKWQEVACYLLALYNRVHRAIDKKYKAGQCPEGEVQKLKDGTYPTVDNTDELFKAHKGVTKIEMSFANRALGGKIQARVQPHLASASGLTSAAAAASPSLFPVSEIMAEPRLSQASVKVTWDQKKLEKHIAITMPKELHASIKEWLMDAVRISLDPASHENRIVDHLTLRPAYLMNGNAKLDAKLLCLSSCLNRHSLTRAREMMVAFVFESIRSRFDAYRAGGSSYHRVVPRKHVALLDEYTEKLEAATSVAEKIKLLIDLRNVLISRSSVDLLGRLDEGLSEIYNVMGLRFPDVPVLNADQRCTEHKGLVTLDIKVSVNDGDNERVGELEEAINVVLLKCSASKLPGSRLSSLLGQMAHAQPSEKVTVLGACLRIAQLSEDQKSNLQALPERVAACVKSYCSTGRYGGLFERAHAQPALEFLDALTSAGLSKDQQLTRLLDFHNALAAQNSVELLGGIDNVLVTVFDVLQVNESQLSARAAAAACGR